MIYLPAYSSCHLVLFVSGRVRKYFDPVSIVVLEYRLYEIADRGKSEISRYIPNAELSAVSWHMGKQFSPGRFPLWRGNGIDLPTSRLPEVLLVRTQSAICQQIKQVAMRCGKIWFDLQCPSIAGLGLASPPQVAEGGTQIVMRQKEIRSDRQRPSVTGLGLVWPALLLEDIAQLCMRP